MLLIIILLINYIYYLILKDVNLVYEKNEYQKGKELLLINDEKIIYIFFFRYIVLKVC